MEYIGLIFSLGLGLVIGSFLNCLAWRLYHDKSLNGRSHCPGCGSLIRWFDNIPLVSFFALRRRCRSCDMKISWQYPVVEAVTAVFFACAAWHIAVKFGLWIEWDWRAWLTLVRDWLLLSSLIVIFIMDARWYVILDAVTLPVAGLMIGINLALGMPWQELALSATIGTGFFLAQYAISRGRWIGGGDIRLGLLLGVALGWPGIILAIFLGYFAGALVGIGLLATGQKRWGSALPLGTFLAVAAAATLWWGEPIINWYLHFINLR